MISPARRSIAGLLLLLLSLAACHSPPPPAGPSPTPTREPPVGVSFATRLPPTPAVVQTTPTPLPPPTATPSPTPIIYAIEAGDTLLAIALARGTTTEEIIALNPGVRPELLQIGQQLVLPPPATPIFAGAPPTPLPLQIDVAQAELYRTPSGATWLLGVVRSETDIWAENVRLGVTVLGPDGRSLGETAVWVAAGLIPPGGTAPFGLLWPGELPAGSTPQIAVVDGRGLTRPGAAANDNRTIDLQVEEEALQESDDGGAVTLTGQVRNLGDQPATGVVVTASLFDSQQRLTGFVQLTLDGLIPPGESRSFTISAAPPGGPAASATFNVQGLLE